MRTYSVGKLFFSGRPLQAIVHSGSVMIASLALLSTPVVCTAADTPSLAPYNVVWDSPSEDSRGSMPLGNGEIGANVWMEKNGDLLLYLSKTDAWGDDVYGSYGLPKIGRVRIHFLDDLLPAGKPFRQVLQLSEGAVTIQTGNRERPLHLKVWVDANHPVVHVEGTSVIPARIQVTIDTYRTRPANGLNADTILPARKDRIGWCYQNKNQTIPQLTNRTFGALIQGDRMVPINDTTLRSASEQKRFDVRLYPLTAQTPTPEAWQTLANQRVDAEQRVKSGDAYRQHQKWWRDFWNRSWVIVGGDADARTVTQGYVLQRFVTACAGRGTFPIKFNGSLFTTDYAIKRKDDATGKETVEMVTADHRTWGGQYWFQNTRPMYWAMLQSGDLEMMPPLFRMYAAKLPASEKLVRDYYGHGGTYFAETSPFWAELPNVKPDEKPWYTNRYYTPILELSVMMLDYFDYTGDTVFVRDTLIPVADAGLTFFDKHFPRTTNGQLYFKDSNSIETYWKVNDPAPDIAGLHYVLTRMLALPEEVSTPAQRERWRALQRILPDLPMGEEKGKKVLLPFRSADNAPRMNGENPELYAVYPFRLYGLGKPDLVQARDTFAVRQARGSGCWSQDPVHAAYLGDVETARSGVVKNFSDSSRDPVMRFPAFWGPFNDYTPDQDNGGNGIAALQLMVLQAEGENLLLLPAWSTVWDVDFKLHAPRNTVVRGKFEKGRLVSLDITPRSRRKDIHLVQPDGSLTPIPERLASIK